MSTVLRTDPDVQPAVDDGGSLLWQGDSYRVIEMRLWHPAACFDHGTAWCAREAPHGPLRVVLERLLHTDALGQDAWGATDALPAEAVGAMLRDLALMGRADEQPTPQPLSQPGKARYECAFCGRVEMGSAEEGILGWKFIRASKSMAFIRETACPGCVRTAEPWQLGSAS